METKPNQFVEMHKRIMEAHQKAYKMVREKLVAKSLQKAMPPKVQKP